MVANEVESLHRKFFMVMGLKRKEGSVDVVEKSLQVKGEGRVRNVRDNEVQYFSFRKVDVVVGHQKKKIVERGVEIEV